MQFTRLRLLGFKTFVEPTDFRIEPGLTGVVGPNGCGKSNLVEALRWVMGESSYKSMRASGMDDVIFSGSGRRPGRNTAEVTLYLDNSTRRAPAAFNDTDTLEVTRRIEREAGSVYRVNARDVRARDVQLLFADASTGARSPALVRQGQIGELISAKPQQRRAILEEASGISGLHSRRAEAETRLKAAEQNLERVGDILGQIDSQLDYLRRQARQAGRYRALSAEIRQLEARQAHQRWIAARDALVEAEQGLTAATLAMADAEANQVRAATVQAIAVRELPTLREAEARAAATVQRLRIAASELDQDEARIRVRIGELDQRLADLAADIAREQQMLADHGGALEKLDDEEADLGFEAETAIDAMETARAALAEREADLTASDRALAAATAALADIQARRQQLDRAIREASERTLRCEAEIATVERELAAIERRLADAPEVAAGRATLEAAEAALDQSEALAVEAEAACAAARETEARKRPAVADAERDLGQLDAEAAALAKVLAATSASTQPLIDAMRVAAGYETAIGAALGSDVDVSLDPHALVHWSQPGDAATDPALPDGARAIIDAVEAPDLMRRRLRQIGVVERFVGAALQAHLHPGQCLVSREGDVWRWDGFVAAADAPSAAALRFAQRNRLTELERLSETARAKLYAARAELDIASRAVRGAVETERVARDQWRRDQRLVGEARESLSRAERELGQVTARLSALEEAKARLSVGRDEARAALEAAQSHLAALPTADGPTRALMEGRTAVAQHRAAVAEARAAVGTLTREAELRARRLEAIARERRGWQDRARNAQAQIGILDQRRTDMLAEKATLCERPDEIALARRRLLTEIANAETARSAAADHLAKGELAVAEADRLARAMLDALADVRIALGRSEERRDAARQRRDEVSARIADQFEIDPPALAGLIETLPPIVEDGEATDRRLERLRLERERLGGVNLRADDEAAEVEARRDALTRERDDLDGAIQRLRTGIATLNRDARDRLQASFDVVNQHFKDLFTRLFNGGDAELRLVDSDDPLEAGLEIIARPPGKKPQTMTLLSGGEQALTAMALIFAVFLTNPAPICVLDEVDAPLDDANVERYCDLLDAMTRQTKTRFIVITHNPITMARMDRLFGVTMAEKGVSQLVSVDLEAAGRFLEAV